MGILQDGDGDYLAAPTVTYENKDLTFDVIYPVGSIYLSSDSSAPSRVFEGTTWTQMRTLQLLQDGSSNQYTTIYVWQRTE